jgi:hypothetical protein
MADPPTQPPSREADWLPRVDAPPSVEPPGEDLELYLAGLSALRKGHDPRRAEVLLQLYRQQHPEGAFVEESWALSIEAAGLRAQSPRELAEDYLQRFPHGRFRALARQALTR